MDSANPFWDFWYFHIPNYVLAALIYTLAGRFVMSFFFPRDWQNYIWQAFLRMTDWIVDLAGLITPRMVHPMLLVPVAAFWLFVARVLLLLGLTAVGLGVGQGGGLGPMPPAAGS